jgi:F-type H+-transporting ATPase subunit b
VHGAMALHALLADKNPILPAANELIWGSIAFVILFVLMARMVFPRLNQALQGRTTKIQGDLDQAEHDREEAARLLEEYRSQLAAAREEAGRMLEEARKNAESVRRDLLSKAEADARRVVERAQEEIQAERNRAVSEIRGQAAGLALDLAGRVIGESLDDDRHRRLIERYIEQVGPGGQG